MWFLGKTLVASAAVTIMAGFPRDLIVVPQQVMLVEPFFHLLVILHQQVQRSQARARAFFLSFYLRPAGGSTFVPEFGPPLSSLFETCFENTANAARVANRALIQLVRGV